MLNKDTQSALSKGFSKNGCLLERVRRVFVFAVSSLFVATNANAAPNQLKKDLNKATIPFELIDNRIFTEVYLNSEGPFEVIFDTGGCLSITPRVAKLLKCITRPDGFATGAGENKLPLLRTEISKVRLGELSLKHQDCLIIEYGEIQRKLAIPVLDGVIGAEYLKRYLIQIDFERRQMSFFQSLDPHLVKDFRKIPCRFVDGMPIIRGHVQGYSARILIDTGDRSGLTIRKNFAEQNLMHDVFEKGSFHITGYGIGGAIFGKVARVPSLKLGPSYILKNVISRMPTSKMGFNVMNEFDCSIGNEILQQFDIVLDYNGSCIYLRPNRFFGSRTEFHPIKY